MEAEFVKNPHWRAKYSSAQVAGFVQMAMDRGDLIAPAVNDVEIDESPGTTTDINVEYEEIREYCEYTWKRTAYAIQESPTLNPHNYDWDHLKKWVTNSAKKEAKVPTNKPIKQYKNIERLRVLREVTTRMWQQTQEKLRAVA